MHPQLRSCPILLTVTACLSNAFVAPDTAAQSDLSLRTRSMSPALAGIIDDYITDSHLNPAAAAGQKARLAYLIRHPSRRLDRLFPDESIEVSEYRMRPLPRADFVSPIFYTPYGFTFFQPIGERTMSVTSLQLHFDNSDVASEKNEVFIREAFLSPEVHPLPTMSMGGSNLTHLLLEQSLACSRGEWAWGIRLRAAYDRFSDNHGSDRTFYYSLLTDPIETKITTSYSNDEYKHEQTTFALEGGILSSASLLKDLVIGAGMVRYIFRQAIVQQSLEDNDWDRNGMGYPGGPIEFYLGEGSRFIDRDYRIYTAVARLHLQLPGQMRILMALSGAGGGGEGSASSDVIVDERENNRSDQFGQSLSACLEGEMQRVDGSITIGRYSQPRPDLILAYGLQALYSSTDFDEQGRGTGWVYYRSNSMVDSLNLMASYREVRKQFVGVHRLVIPTAVEWVVGDRIRLRVGFEWLASRTRTTEDVTFEMVPPHSLLPFPLQEQIRRSSVEYMTGVAFKEGLELKISDVFSLELFSRSNHRLSLAEFGYMSLRGRF